MATEFVMPKLGLTMEAGTIIRWLVDPGAEVRAGQPVLVIETDKVESEVEASHDGLLTRAGLVGEEYPCGATIGWFLDEGEASPDAGAPVTASIGVGGRVLASPNARRVAAERGVELASVAGSGPGGRITSEDVLDVEVPAPMAPAHAPAALPRPDTAPAPTAPPDAGRRTLATAAARNLADLLGIDLAAVTPAGVDPRLTRDDVAAHVRRLLADRPAERASDGRPAAGSPTPTTVTPAPTPTPAPAVASLLQEPTSVVPLRGMRGTIARRMSQSLHSMAQLTLTMDVDMDRAVADREHRRSTAGDGPVPGYTDYVIAAAARALLDHPVVNSVVTADGVALLPRVDVGLAVALDDGLIVPVVHDAPSLDLPALAAETSRLAEAAREGGLTLPELEGATFSVTALGMFGVDAFTPIINAPNTAILGVGRIRDDIAWTDDHQPTRARRLTLSLTWDHRAFDGAPAARFVQSVKDLLEAPDRLP